MWLYRLYTHITPDLAYLTVKPQRLDGVESLLYDGVAMVLGI